MIFVAKFLYLNYYFMEFLQETMPLGRTNLLILVYYYHLTENLF